MLEGPPASPLAAALSNIKTVIETIAVIVGGVWAYYKFFKGRTFRPRLELSVSARVAESKGLTNVFASVQLKNVGMSKVEISQKGTALRVLATDPTKTDGPAAWEHAVTVGVFESHRWIEPGEPIADQALVSIAGTGHKAVKLELRIVGGGIEWNAISIVEPEKNTK
jgi:hypothetical protein